MSKKIAEENVSKLASIGIAAMEFEAARRRAYLALQAIRAARRQAAEDWDGEDPETDPGIAEKTSGYAVAARERKNARERMLRMISRYRDWLDGVNAPKRA